MRLAHRTILTAMTACAAVVMPGWLAGQEAPHHPHVYHHYKLVEIGTFGGAQSFNEWAGIGYRMMNSRGIATGQADTLASDPNCIGTPDSCAISYAFLWQDGALTKLGGLPRDTEGSYAASINDRGWISGFSGNGLIDQTGFPELVAVLWKDGKITNLGTLRGNASSASAMNNRGQIVGAALNTIPDAFSTGFPSPLCGGQSCIGETYGALIFPSTTQMHAVLWQNGGITDLGTLGGPDSFASQINERGQIAGQSYIDSTPNGTTGVPTIDAFFIGEDGKMVDLGNLGGTVSYATGLNNRGQVIGGMTVAGDTGFHPFLWDHGILTDLGTLGFDCGLANALNDAGEIVGVACSSSTSFFATLWRDGALINLGTVQGDTWSEAYAINSRSQVVGESGRFESGAPNHAFLWEEDGPMINLNSLIPADSMIRLGHAVSINDRGEIAGTGALPNGDHRAFLLIPCDEDHLGVEGCDYSMVDASTAAGVVPDVMKHQSVAAQNASPLPQGAAQTGSVSLNPTHMYFVCHFGVGAPPGCTSPLTAMLRNAGATSVYLQAITVGGQYFLEKNSCPMAPKALQPGQSCAITVSFFNPRVGRGCGSCRVTRTSTVNVYDTASGSPQSIALTGFISVN